MTSQPPGRERSPSPRLGRAFWTLCGASGGSNLADGVFKVIVPLLAVSLTREPMLIANITVATSAPWLVFALPIGALIDRFDRRRVMLAANTGRGLLVAILAALAATGTAQIWMLYVIGVAVGIEEVFYDTSAQSILPQIVDRDHLDRANSRLMIVELGANSFVGPPLAGLLMGLSTALSFITPAALWGLAVGAMLGIGGSYRVERASGTSLAREIGEGLAFLGRQGVLRGLAIMTGVANCAGSISAAVFVLFAVGQGSAMGLNEAQFGLLLAASAVGSLGGALVAERLTARFGRQFLFGACNGVFALTMAVPIITANPWLIGLAWLIDGLSIAVWNINAVSLRQRLIPPRLLGRLNSAYRLLAWGTIPLGAWLGGVIASWLDLRWAFGAAAAMVAATLALLPQISNGRIAAAEQAFNQESDDGPPPDAAPGPPQS